MTINGMILYFKHIIHIDDFPVNGHPHGYTPARGYVNIPNLVYKSLDVRYTVCFYNYKFHERCDVGACCNIALGVGCNTLTVKKIGRIVGVNRANCDTSTKVGM